MSDTKILIVEDEVELLEVYSEILGNDYVVFKAENGKDAIEIFDKENPDIAILDIKLPDKIYQG